jgi:hypothetical protein
VVFVVAFCQKGTARRCRGVWHVVGPSFVSFLKHSTFLQLDILDILDILDMLDILDCAHYMDIICDGMLDRWHGCMVACQCGCHMYTNQQSNQPKPTNQHVLAILAIHGAFGYAGMPKHESHKCGASHT